MMILMFLLSGEPSFDTRVVEKLSQMLGVARPQRILVERVEQKELIGEVRRSIMVSCMQGQIVRFQYCSEASKANNLFVYGLWIKEKDKNFLHIKLHKHAGLDSLIHEFCHWYLHYQGETEGLLNNHEILLPLASTLLVSEDFVSWLEKEEGK